MDTRSATGGADAGGATAAATGAPMTADRAEALFLAHLPALDRIIGIMAARSGLRGADAEDFGGWVRVRLMEDDYQVLRKFSGRSSLTTYLSVVVANLSRDFRTRRQGRWRPSAAARRLGPVAERLERMVHRNRLGFGEAVAVLRSEGATTASDRELAELLGAIPVRPPLRPDPAGDEPLATLPSSEAADAGVTAEEEGRERESVRRALGRALGALPAEDRLILRMRFWDELSVADVARGLGLPQKPLYRRIERALASLREGLVAEDVRPEQVLAFIGRGEEGGWDFPAPDPSKETG
jgi:RNA polymerase sigma factor (sigma-70 family)